MPAGRHCSLREILAWTRRDIAYLVGLGSLPLILHRFGVDVAVLPWPPLAVLGIAVAFITGFKSADLERAYDETLVGILIGKYTSATSDPGPPRR
ncbi:MAG: hypothetical protein QM778_31195 [Myxococcales bacterium]